MDNSKLGKLVPKRIKAHRERKRQASIAGTASSRASLESGAGMEAEDDAAPRGRSISRQETNTTNNSSTVDNSSMADTDQTSLISYDSDPTP
jgi:hypothetical protein